MKVFIFLYLFVGIGALEFIGDNCGMPFAGLATGLIAGAATLVNEHQKVIFLLIVFRVD